MQNQQVTSEASSIIISSHENINASHYRFFSSENGCRNLAACLGSAAALAILHLTLSLIDEKPVREGLIVSAGGVALIVAVLWCCYPRQVEQGAIHLSQEDLIARLDAYQNVSEISPV